MDNAIIEPIIAGKRTNLKLHSYVHSVSLTKVTLHDRILEIHNSASI